jgi:hypothetical protein
MADDLTNTTFPSDDIDDTKQHRGGNPNASQNVTNEDRSKGGKASSSQQNGDGHQLTDEERSRGGSK